MKSVNFFSLPVTPFILMFLLSNTSLGQNYVWSEAVVGSDDVEAVDVVYTNTDGVWGLINFEGSLQINGETYSSFGDESTLFFNSNEDGEIQNAVPLIGSGEVKGTDIVFDDMLYLACQYSDNIQIGDSTLQNLQGENALLARFNEDGLNEGWVNFSSTGQVSGVRLVTNASGNVYACGSFQEQINFGSDSLTSFGQESIFLIGLNSDLEPLWSQKYDSQESVEITGLEINADDELFVSATFEGNLLLGTDVVPNSSGKDMVIFSVGNDQSIDWFYSAGSDEEVEIMDITLNEDNLIATGFYEGTLFLPDSTFTSTGDKDSYLLSLNQEGEFDWLLRINSEDDVEAVSLDCEDEQCALLGTNEGNVTFNETEIINGSNDDMFVLWFAADGGIQYP
ncbi:MAG: hypothetical protein AAF193_07720, partial [Bacteroidota bacterium]